MLCSPVLWALTVSWLQRGAGWVARDRSNLSNIFSDTWIGTARFFLGSFGLACSRSGSEADLGGTWILFI